jgi:hypothetical protein
MGVAFAYGQVDQPSLARSFIPQDWDLASCIYFIGKM